MAKLELHDLKPYENSKGKYLEVMGVTSSEIVVIGSGGKTSSLPLEIHPKAAAKDLIYLNDNNEIVNIDNSEEKLKEAMAKASTQQNSHKGCNRALDNSYLTRSV